MTPIPASTQSGASLEVTGRVATVVIDRPLARNAMTLDTWRALPALMGQVEDDPSIAAVILRGASGHFGSGNDIGAFGALHGDPVGAEAFGAAMATAMRAVETCSRPVVVAIEGSCFGAAVALAMAMAGDVRLASDTARFAVTPARLGAVYLRSDLHRLTAAIGMGRTKALIYSAEAIDADEALRIGLIDRTVANEAFEAELDRFVERVLSGSPFTLRQTKAMLRGVGSGQTPAETPETLAAFVAATQGEDFREGVAAFLAKRQPVFR